MGLFALVTLFALAGSAQAAPNTTVSLTFDDGRPSQMAAEQELVSRGMKATYFIITSQIGLPGVMSLANLNALEADGMEIGAHTVLHRNLPTLSGDEAMRELCLSRGWLMDRGFDIYDMAYPYDVTSANVKQSVASCGYNSARAGGQLQCDSGHACAETVPPLDPFALRSPNDFNVSTTLAQMKAAVTNAENNGGGWVPLELHDVCNGEGDPLLPAGAHCSAPYYITRSIYTQFLDWLKGEVDAGRVQVKTVHEVVGGSLKPKVVVDPAPVRNGNLLVNPSFEQASASGTPSDCWVNINNGPDAPPAIATTNDAHSGSKALTINVPAAYDSWAYNLIAPALDLAQCAPTAFGGHHYTFTGWYAGNGQIKVAAYWRNADNQWTRLDWGPAGTATFPAAAAWTKATFTFQAPAGATAVSAGFYVDGTGVIGMGGNQYTIDDTSLIDQDAVPLSLTVNRAGSGSGTVTSSPPGIACGSTCQADFTEGSSVTLTAAAAAGSSFTGWSGACSGSSATCSLSMSAAKSVTATFTLPPVQLSVARNGTGSGAVTSSPGGIDCGPTCQATFPNGASVTLTATPADTSSFTGWSGACSGASATCTVAMSAAKSATATFTLLPVALNVAKTGTGDGTVSSSPAGIACGATCQAGFTNGSSVTLTAVADVTSSFTGWSGACTGAAATCSVSLNAAKSVSATFTLLPGQLTVSKGGTGSGAVNSDPAGIACGATCQASFVNGTAVTLTAVAAPGSSFTGWSGACSGSLATCDLSLTTGRAVIATFTFNATIAVVRAGMGSGTVSSSPAGIDCGTTCQASVSYGTTLTLTAVAAQGSTFMGWSGACAGTSPACTLGMTADRAANATFAITPELTVLKAGTGTGSVSSGPSGIDCAAGCAEQHATFAPGTTVTLTAAAADGSTFAGWSDGSCAGAASCTFSLATARTVTATFVANPPPPPTSPASDTGTPAVAAGPLAPAATQPRAVAGTTRPALRTRPKVSGRARAGRLLICTRGSWNGSPSHYGLTWRRDGKAIVGHGSSYRVRTADRGHSIRCYVTAKNAKGLTTAASAVLRVPR